ncbi:MAG: DNA-binding response regulator [Cyanobacteria bacterium QS_8_64_29]|nr:MAG: DNA-binding response regulator [Cyanobacteria bacterium QS_8_64_29]
MAEQAKLLLVDDEPGLRESVKAYLEEGESFTVRAASDAQQAWELLQDETPDLAIVDIMMPQVDGYEFLRQLRADPRFKALPAIFLTAKGMTADRIQGYEAGCDAYLSKPFEPEELVAIIKNLLQRRSTLTEGSVESSELDSIAQQIAEIKGMLGQRSRAATADRDVAVALTPRERSVLKLVTDGLMNKEIARELDTSVRNVEKYVSRLFSKTGTNSRTELVRYALQHGELEQE